MLAPERLSPRNDERDKLRDDAPAVRLLARLEERALTLRASDVHIEPAGGNGAGRVRLRVDGVLQQFDVLSSDVMNALISRIKLLAGLDIADRRLPQDGRYSVEFCGQTVDARVATTPSVDGEKMVIRLLNAQGRVPQLEQLGMQRGLLERYRDAIAAAGGFVIVAGPVGSGKTTTLYSSLREIGSDASSTYTVEDPVEMRLDGATQVNVNVRSGLTFSSVLRSFLRLDPDVIMIGEMRDSESAALASRAALSGQLVLTTLHSSDAPGALERLVDLGVHRTVMAAVLRGVLAQRLVRRLCRACRIPANGGSPGGSFLAHGCSECNGTGYMGRIGVYEFLDFDCESRAAVGSGAPGFAIREIAKARGYQPLFFDGIAKVGSGDTTLSELRRVSVGAS